MTDSRGGMMFDYERKRELREWLDKVLVASVFVAPGEAGLSAEEIGELGARRSLGRAEVDGALLDFEEDNRESDLDDGRYRPSAVATTWHLIDFNSIFVDDPRSIDAFAFVYDSFVEEGRTHGTKAIDREVLVQRGVVAGHKRHDLEVACASFVAARQASMNGGSMIWKGAWVHPKKQQRRRQNEKHPVASVLAAVRDVCSRRTDKRSLSIDPVHAFAEQLPSLGHENVRLWWQSTATELRTLDSRTHATARLVLAASLSEAALTLVVRRVQAITGGLGFSGRAFLAGEPVRNWKFEDLLRGARHETVKMIDQDRYNACVALNEQRQRIHVGRFMDGATSAAELDTHPHEADAAVLAMERLLSDVLHWLGSHTT